MVESFLTNMVPSYNIILRFVYIKRRQIIPQEMLYVLSFLDYFYDMNCYVCQVVTENLGLYMYYYLIEWIQGLYMYYYLIEWIHTFLKLNYFLFTI